MLDSRTRHLRVWLWTIVSFTFAILIVGGTTRLTQSGLSIVDWKPIVGVVPPLSDAQWQSAFARYREFPEFQQLRPEMTLSEFKVIFFWEYLHRLLARAVGVVFLVPFLFFWMRGYFSRPLLLRVVMLFALGATQGVIGWLMVKSGLVDRPSVSHYRLALHLSMAIAIAGWATWLARDLTLVGERSVISENTRRLLRRGLAVIGALLAVQIVWGAFVAGLRAGRVFNTFPLMAGSLIPPDLFWLEPTALNFVQNPIAVQWTHRVLGTLLLLAVFAFFLRLSQVSETRTRRFAAGLAALVAAQYALGILTLIFYVPVALGVAHQATAMVTALAWVVWVHDARNQPFLP